MSLSFILAESALELVPKEIRNKPAVGSDARRRGVDPSKILLDRSLHHSAMGRLKDSEKRGRPDLVHAALLAATGTPLYLDGRVRVWVHTYPDIVIELAPKTRIPKSYFRFRGLMEKAIAGRQGGGLVRVLDLSLQDLVRKTIRPSRVFGLSVQGKQEDLADLARKISEEGSPCVVVGGFPHGHYAKDTLVVVDELVRIHPMPLEAHVVTSRVLYETERSMEGTND